MSAVLTSKQEQASALLERVHGIGPALYAQSRLQSSDPGQGLVWVAEGDEVRSACAALPRVFVVDGLEIPIGLIGCVATEPAWRGRGWASRVLREAEQRLRERGCLMALLWAEDPRFYYARGWRPIGAEQDWLLPRDMAERLPSPEETRGLGYADVEQVWRLAQAQPSRVQRTLAEMRALLAGARTQALVLERGGEVLAYTCCGKGHDFPGVVHDWGGEPAALLALLRAELEALPPEREGLYLIAPPDENALGRELAARGARGSQGILGLGKLLDRRAAGRLLARRIAPSGRVEIARDAQGGVEVRLSGSRGGGPLEDDSLLSLLFSPRGEREDIEALGAAFGFDASRLPLLPFAFGLDSI